MNFQRFGRIAAVLALFVAGTASAAPVRFNFTWSGTPFQNTASATGYIVLETTLLPNPGSQLYTLPNAAVVDLSITITGATAGNGTFNLASFRNVIWDTRGTTLDLTRQVVGQPTAGGTWGTPSGNAGDFNLFSISVQTGTDAPSALYSRAPNGTVVGPQGVNFFTLATNGGTGQNMALTSFAPAGSGTSFVSNVPATNRTGLAALAGLLALAGAFAARRLRAR